MIAPVQTVYKSTYPINIKLPEDYFSISYGFPDGSSLLCKGSDTGITLVAIGYLKPEYAPKAIDRWKHNLRKQLGNVVFQQAMYRTMLMYMDNESVDLYLRHLYDAAQEKYPDMFWDFKTLEGNTNAVVY